MQKLTFNNDLMTRRETAEYIRCAERTLANWASSGVGGPPYLKLGRKVMYRRADVDRWLEAQTVAPAAAC